MKLIRGIHNITKADQRGMVAIGNFDGVHRGHQLLLQELTAKAKAHHTFSLVIIFEPQPKEYFQQPCDVARLTNLREKLFYLASCGVDKVLCLRFNAAFAALTADAFVEQLLVQQLAISEIYAGEDFRFGYRRQGDLAFLRQASMVHQFRVHSISDVVQDTSRVSSTLVRQALQQGDLHTAAQYLHRDYRIHGRVGHGDKRGRQLGFATANIALKRQVCALRGVFAVRVYGLENEPLNAVANVGSRPTVDGVRTLLEVHIFDFDDTIYGRHLQVEFLHKLRDEKRFDGLPALQQQLQQDCQQAKDFLNTHE